MQLHFSVCVSFFLISITLYQIPICFCVDYEEICSSSFHCANLKNLGYPFWGSETEEFCGHPEFELVCDGVYAEITIMSERYRVLEVNYSDYSLRVVRADFWNNPCPTYFRNNSINSTFFEYRSDYRDLTLYYGCLSPPFSLPYILSTKFNCNINNTETVSYFLTGVSEIYGNYQTGTCNSTVIVPILESQVRTLEEHSSEENLKTAINNGFGLKWKANDSLCFGCRKSGGQCGYNPTSSEFTCYCRDGPVPSACESSKYQCSSNSCAQMHNTELQHDKTFNVVQFEEMCLYKPSFDALVLHRLEFEKLVASVNLDRWICFEFQ